MKARAANVGDIVRCKRCRITAEVKHCPAGTGLAIAVVFVDQYGAAQLVADRAIEFCNECITPDDMLGLELSATAHRAGTAGN